MIWTLEGLERRFITRAFYIMITITKASIHLASRRGREPKVRERLVGRGLLSSNYEFVPSEENVFIIGHRKANWSGYIGNRQCSNPLLIHFISRRATCKRALGCQRSGLFICFRSEQSKILPRYLWLSVTPPFVNSKHFSISVRRPASTAQVSDWKMRLMQLDRGKLNDTTATGVCAYLFLPVPSHYVAEKEANKMHMHQSLRRTGANDPFITFKLR